MPFDFLPGSWPSPDLPSLPDGIDDVPAYDNPDAFAEGAIDDIIAQLRDALLATEGIDFPEFMPGDQTDPHQARSVFSLLSMLHSMHDANDDLPPLPAETLPSIVPPPPRPVPSVPYVEPPATPPVIPPVTPVTPPIAPPALPPLSRLPTRIDRHDPAEMGLLYDDLSALVRRGVALVEARGALVPPDASTATGPDLTGVIARLRATLVAADALSADVTRFTADVDAINRRVDAMLETRRRMRDAGFTRPDRLSEITDPTVREIYTWIKNRDRGFPRWYPSAVRVSTDTAVWLIPRTSGLPADEVNVWYAIGETGELVRRTTDADRITEMRTFRGGRWEVHPS